VPQVTITTETAVVMAVATVVMAVTAVVMMMATIALHPSLEIETPTMVRLRPRAGTNIDANLEVATATHMTRLRQPGRRNLLSRSFPTSASSEPISIPLKVEPKIHVSIRPLVIDWLLGKHIIRKRGTSYVTPALSIPTYMMRN
jgi:hypothetical protein